MIVHTIKVTIKCSKEITPGQWIATELGAEATIGHTEPWQAHQLALYNELKAQLKAVFLTVETKANGQRPPSEPPPRRVCPEHKAAKGSRNGGLFCPAKLPNGQYCTWNTAPDTTAVAK